MPMSFASGENASSPTVGVWSSSLLKTWTANVVGAGQAASMAVAARPTMTRLWSSCGSTDCASDAWTTGAGLDTISDTFCELLPRLVSGGVPAAAEAMLSITVPFGRLQLTCATTMNFAAAPLLRLSALHAIAPELPTAGEVQLHPGAAPNDTRLVPAGTASLNVRLPAPAGPSLVTMTVYVTDVPASTTPAGEVVFITAMSATQSANRKAPIRVAQVYWLLVTGWYVPVYQNEQSSAGSSAIWL